MSEELRELTAEEALRMLREAVEEKGADYVYVNPDGDSPEKGGFVVSCKYFDWDTDTPSCIVGHVYAKAGASRWDVTEDVGPGGQGIYQDPSGEILGRQVDGFWYRDNVTRILAAAQRVQDEGGTWGEALEAAEEQAKVVEAVAAA